jgi:hypothetical protein
MGDMDVVGILEIAERLGLKPQTVAAWRSPSRQAFTLEPKWTVSGSPAWNWADVERWAIKSRRFIRVDQQLPVTRGRDNAKTYLPPGTWISRSLAPGDRGRYFIEATGPSRPDRVRFSVSGEHYSADWQLFKRSVSMAPAMPIEQR